MKRMFKIYLETSVISALFDERNPERMSSTHGFRHVEIVTPAELL